MICLTQLKILRVKVYQEMAAPGWPSPKGDSQDEILCELEIHHGIWTGL